MPKDKLNIAIMVDPEFPVPPPKYGGIERIVYMLICGLMERGHTVTLFGNKRSNVPCKFVPYIGEWSLPLKDTMQNVYLLTKYAYKEKYDLIHNFARLAYLLGVLPNKIPKIMSYQRPISQRSVTMGNLLGGKSLHYTAISHQMVLPEIQKIGSWRVIYNAAPIDFYKPNTQVDPRTAPLAFLGRLDPIKGTDLAIEIAKKTNRKLIIAGNVPEEETNQTFYREKVKPYIDDDQITYIGEVNDEQKNKLLGEAAALLMPIRWNEPFGIVMAEALACGTPVIGISKGAVPEVVSNGKNGFVCNDVQEMMDAVHKLPEIDRATCRRIAEEKFSDKILTDQYEALYREMVRRA